MGQGKGSYSSDFINPNFDAEKFDALSKGTLDDGEIDYDLVEKLSRAQQEE